ncbi:MAG: hypothetical protein QOD77_1856 [Thermoplasmata archaeon]|jgi:hypothetical protein|nr:hypothetical protein [Thermoplasmata archaeon]
MSAEPPPLPQVPATLADPPRAALAAQRAGLAQEYLALNRRVEAFVSRCADVEVGSARDVECTVEDGAIAQAKAGVAARAWAFVATLDAALQAERARRRRALEVEMEGLRTRGLATRAAEFEAWAELASDAKDDLARDAVGKAIRLTLAAAQAGAAALPAFTPAQAARLELLLMEHEVAAPETIALLNAVADNAKGREAVARAAQQLLPQMPAVLDKLLAKPSSHPGLDALLALAQVVGGIWGGPAAAVVMVVGPTVGAWLPAAYVLAVDAPRLAALEKATEADLGRVRRHAARIEAEVHGLRDAEAALHALPAR